MQKISPFLWFDSEAEEAAEFYVSIFKNSKITKVARYGPGAPRPEGSVMIVAFELDGQKFTALNGGPHVTFNESISFVVDCEDQAETDRMWDALCAGGQPVQCGWLRDRYGLSWQVIPKGFVEMVSDPDLVKSGRAMAAMMKMVKLDLAELKRAYDG